MKSYLLKDDQNVVHVAGFDREDNELATVCGLFLTKASDGSFEGPVKERYVVQGQAELTCEFCRNGIWEIVNLADIETLKKWSGESS